MSGFYSRFKFDSTYAADVVNTALQRLKQPPLHTNPDFEIDQTYLPLLLFRVVKAGCVPMQFKVFGEVLSIVIPYVEEITFEEFRIDAVDAVDGVVELLTASLVVEFPKSVFVDSRATMYRPDGSSISRDTGIGFNLAPYRTRSPESFAPVYGT